MENKTNENLEENKKEFNEPVNKTNEELVYNFLVDNYKNEIMEFINKNQKTITIDYELLDNSVGMSGVSDALITNTDETIKKFKRSIIIGLNTHNKEIRGDDINVRFKNIPSYPLKNVLSEHINKLIATEGIVKGIGEVRSQAKVLRYECKSCHQVIVLSTTLTEKNIEPRICTTKKCESRDFWELPSEEGDYEDVRYIILEEKNDKNINENPRRLHIELTDDLIYSVKNGDKVKVTGQLVTIKDSKNNKDQTESFKMIANNIERLENEEIILTQNDIDEFNNIPQSERIDTITKSFASNLVLSDEMKLALLMFLVKGIRLPNEKEPKPIHLLIISDPAQGKTDAGKETESIAEISNITYGASSSGVGLTTALEDDPIIGTKIATPGAIPLTNGGVIVIDELEKLTKSEQETLLEPMQNQTITTDKAGVHEKAEAYVGILGLANPKFGRFDKYKPYSEQITLIEPLLSRFGLKIYMEDVPTVENDTLIAKAVMDKYIEENTTKTPLTKQELRKYIKYAKSIDVKLTGEDEKLLQYYIQNRKTDEGESPHIDIRHFETLIQVCGAIAKLNLKNKIDEEDIENGIEFMEWMLSQTGIDPNTGEPSIDVFNGTATPTDKKNRDIIIRIIKDWREEYDKAPILKSKLKEICEKKHNIKKDSFYTSYNQLKEVGDIYELGKGQDKSVYIAKK